MMKKRSIHGHANGMLAALLAENGYTGPRASSTARRAWFTATAPEWKLNILTDGLGESWLSRNAA